MENLSAEGETHEQLKAGIILGKAFFLITSISMYTWYTVRWMEQGGEEKTC